MEKDKLERFMIIHSQNNPLSVFVPQEFIAGQQGEINLCMYEFSVMNPLSITGVNAGKNPQMIIMSAPQVAFVYDELTKGDGRFWVIPPSDNIVFQGNTYVKYTKIASLEDPIDIGQMTNELTISFTDENGSMINFPFQYEMSIRLFK